MVDGKLTVKQKINLIEKSRRLDGVQLSALPAVHNTDYYFVSYSHLDYKAVYKDLLLLQEEGINIWYDRGLPAGRDWEEMAEEALSKHACIGVIFYLSVNALRSEAILTEIKKVKSLNKDFLAIMLPTPDTGEILSPMEVLHLACEDFDENIEKVKVVREVFGDKIIFLSIDANPGQKVEKIKGLKRPNLYEIADNGAIATLLGVNDNKIIRAELPADALFEEEKTLPVREVGEVAFANFNSLKALQLPFSPRRLYNDPSRFFTVRELAFYRCANLEDINFNNNDIKIESKAFSHCNALKSLSFESAGEVHVGPQSFFGCSNLKELTFNSRTESIAHDAFGDCPIEKINGPDEDDDCDYYALGNCLFNMTGFLVLGSANPDIPDGTFICGQIMPYAFSGNRGLKTFAVPKRTKRINKYAFINTKNLTEVRFFKDGQLDCIDEGAFKNSGVTALSWTGDGDGVKEIAIEKLAFADSALKKADFSGVRVKLSPLAFARCVDLEEIIFDPSQEVIAEGNTDPFIRCVSIERLTLPKNLQAFSGQLFKGAPLKSISGPTREENPEYYVENNCLIHGDTLVKGGAGCVIPPAVKKIGPYAFYGNGALTEIVIPSRVEEIGPYAFAESGLERAVIGGGVRVIGESAFEGCGLKEVTFEDSSVSLSLEKSLFCRCPVKEVLLPKRTARVDRDALYFAGEARVIRLWSGATYSAPLMLTCCDHLEKIIFDGTKEGLLKVLSITDLYESKRDRSIILECADGSFTF